MVYDPTLGFDPMQPGATSGVNTLGSSNAVYSNGGLVAGDPNSMYHTMGSPQYDPQWLAAINQALAAAAANNQFNQGISQGQLKNQTNQVNNTNAYQQGLLANARAQLAQAAQQFQQTYGLNLAGLTGSINGQPTLAAQNQGFQNALAAGQLTGMYNGQQTLPAQQLAQQYGLNLAALSGQLPNGDPTLAAQNQAFQNALAQGQFGLAQSGVTGQFMGAPTLAAQLGLGQLGLGQQQQELNRAAITGNLNGEQTLAGNQQAFNQWLANQQNAQAIGALTGQYNGADTMAMQNQRFNQGMQQANLGLNSLQLGSQLSGPSNWLEYENAAAGIRNNPALAQGVASWADMTNNRPTGTGGWAAGAVPQAKSLQTMATDMGLGAGEQQAQGGGNVTPMYGAAQGQARPNTQATADYMAKVGQSTNQWAPGFWGSLNGDQQKMYRDAWSASGQSPDTILANRARQSIGQGFGRAA